MSRQEEIKYVVVEQDFQTKRVVYGPTTDKTAADRVASQHAARSVVQSRQ